MSALRPAVLSAAVRARLLARLLACPSRRRPVCRAAAAPTSVCCPCRWQPCLRARRCSVVRVSWSAPWWLAPLAQFGLGVAVAALLSAWGVVAALLGL